VKFSIKRALLSVYILVIFIAIAAYFIFRPGVAQKNLKIGIMRQISHEPGLEIDPDISPDGKMVAFVTGPVGQMHLVVRQVAGGRPIAITQDFSGGQRWPREVFPKAKSLNEKALEIDSNSAFAYRVKASISLFFDWDWPAVERSLKRAIELNPGDALFHWIYALFLGWMGRFDEAIRKMRKAVNLDPLSLVINCDMGHIYYCARRYDESMKWYRKTLEIESDYGMAFYHMGFTYAVEKNYKESEKSFKKAIRLTGGLPWSVGLLSYVYSKLGKREKAESLLQELHNRSKKEYIHASCFTMAYSEIEDLDKAFEYWNDAYKEREPTCCTLKVLPHLDPFRSDPRFDELLEKLNLK